MSFALLDAFRKNPVLVAGRTPIVSFDHEQSKGDSNALKPKDGGGESFSVKGESRVTALDFVEQNGVLLMRVATTGVEAKITNEDWMPMYYLPWVANAIARTTLRPRSLTTRAGGAKAIVPMANNNKFRVDQNDPLSAVVDPNDPDVFVTSSVNGCSVTIRGSREEPTVYHGNAKALADATGERGPVGHAIEGRDAAAAALMDLKRQDMERMLTGFEANDPKANRLGGPHTAAQSKMLVQANYQMLVLAGKTAPSAKADVKQISKDVATEKGGKAKNVRLASSQGTVFGVRRLGKWTFYYQKLVKYEFWRDTSSLLAKAKWEKDPTHPAGFHLVEFGEFWPAGPGRLVP